MRTTTAANGRNRRNRIGPATAGPGLGTATCRPSFGIVSGEARGARICGWKTTWNTNIYMRPPLADDLSPAFDEFEAALPASAKASRVFSVAPQPRIDLADRGPV
jgi:hypothetical protein